MILRALNADDAPALRRIHASSAVAAWWGPPEEEFPLSDDPSVTRLTIWTRDQVAGLLQFSEESEPEYRHASVDISLAPELHCQGLGTDALTTLVHYLIVDRGHHRVMIDPAAENVVAIRCYEKVGFRRVGVIHQAWRDPAGSWRHVLLMELVTLPR